MAELETEFKTEADALAATTDPLLEKLEHVSLKPTKSNITVKLVALTWAPFWAENSGTSRPAWE